MTRLAAARHFPAGRGGATAEEIRSGGWFARIHTPRVPPLAVAQAHVQALNAAIRDMTPDPELVHLREGQLGETGQFAAIIEGIDR